MDSTQVLLDMKNEIKFLSKFLKDYPAERYQDNPLWQAYYRRLEELKEEVRRMEESEIPGGLW